MNLVRFPGLVVFFKEWGIILSSLLFLHSKSNSATVINHARKIEATCFNHAPAFQVLKNDEKRESNGSTIHC